VEAPENKRDCEGKTTRRITPLVGVIGRESKPRFLVCIGGEANESTKKKLGCLDTKTYVKERELKSEGGNFSLGSARALKNTTRPPTERGGEKGTQFRLNSLEGGTRRKNVIV